MLRSKAARPLAVACLVVACAAPASAGPRLRAPGSHYTKIEYSYYRATNAFDASGASASLADRRFINDLGGLFEEAAYTASGPRAYLEVGVLPGVEFFSSLPLVFARQRWSDPVVEQRNSGVGRKLGSVVASFSFALVLPLYDNNRQDLNYGPGNLDFSDDKPVLGQGTIDAVPVVVDWCPLIAGGDLFLREIDGVVYHYSVAGLWGSANTLTERELIAEGANTVYSLWNGIGLVGPRADAHIEQYPALVGRGTLDQFRMRFADTDCQVMTASEYSSR